AEPWRLPDCFLASAVSLTLDMELGPTVCEALRASEARLQGFVRRPDSHSSLLAIDHRGRDIPAPLRRTMWLAGTRTILVRFGVRDRFSPVTSWFHKTERELAPVHDVVRVVVRDAMVLAGRVVDVQGAGVPAVTVRFAP